MKPSQRYQHKYTVTQSHNGLIVCRLLCCFHNLGNLDVRNYNVKYNFMNNLFINQES